MSELKFEVEVVKPKLLGNFDAFVVAIDEYTKQFEIEVTSENLKEAKESGAELNKIKKQVKDTAKKYLDEAMEPINDFKLEVAKIESLIESKRQNIVSGVSVFEDAKRLEHIEAMRAYMTEALSKVELREEFKMRLVLPSPSVSGLTQSGGLVKKFKDEIDAIIVQAVEAQRLKDIEVENQRLRDEARAREIVEEMREREHQKAINRLVDKPPMQMERAQEAKQEEAKRENADGKSVYRITLEFEVQSKSGISCEAMIQKVLPMIYGKQIPISNQRCEEV
jgi:hypothetical protein